VTFLFSGPPVRRITGVTTSTNSRHRLSLTNNASIRAFFQASIIKPTITIFVVKVTGFLIATTRPFVLLNT
jgi:hypothetical protein